MEQAKILTKILVEKEYDIGEVQALALYSILELISDGREWKIHCNSCRWN